MAEGENTMLNKHFTKREKELSTKLQFVKDECQHYKDKYKRACDRFSELRKTLSSEKRCANDKSKDDNEVEALKALVTKQRKEIQDKAEEIHKLRQKSELSQQILEIKQLKNLISSYKKEIEEKEQNISTQNRTYENLRVDFRKAKIAIWTLLKNLQKNRASITEKDLIISKQSAELKDKAEQIEKLEEKLQCQLSEYADALREKECNQRSLQEAQNEATQVDKYVDQLEEEHKQFRIKAKKNDEWKEEIQILKKELQVYKTKSEKDYLKIKKLNGLIENVRENYGKKESETVKSLEELRIKHNAELEEKSEQIRKVKHDSKVQLSQIHSKLKTQEKVIANCQLEVTILKDIVRMSRSKKLQVKQKVCVYEEKIEMLKKEKTAFLRFLEWLIRKFPFEVDGIDELTGTVNLAEIIEPLKTKMENELQIYEKFKKFLHSLEPNGSRLQVAYPHETYQPQDHSSSSSVKKIVPANPASDSAEGSTISSFSVRPRKRPRIENDEPNRVLPVFRCLACPWVYYDMSTLKRHMEADHQPQSLADMEYGCKICGALFTCKDKKKYKEHCQRCTAVEN